MFAIIVARHTHIDQETRDGGGGLLGTYKQRPIGPFNPFLARPSTFPSFSILPELCGTISDCLDFFKNRYDLMKVLYVAQGELSFVKS